MNQILRQSFEGERSLFNSNDLEICECVFDNGESPLKESSNLKISETLFRWKYPLWYCENVDVKLCTFFDMARAGIWYSKSLRFADTLIQAPKAFRRCEDLALSNVTFTNAAETLWNCKNVKLNNVTAKGDYFAMNCENMELDHFTLDGNYSFDGVKNMTIKNSILASKDAFWNTENVTVENSFITGEYLGWNAKNLTLINCTIESLQGLCYIDNLKMVNCKIVNTNLAFEYSKDIDAEVTGDIISILNPGSGIIKAEHIKELIIEKDKTDFNPANIVCKVIDKKSDVVTY